MRWFKHMTASADDEKLSRLEDAFGLEGYGFWWRVVEIVAGKVDADGHTSVEFSPKKWGSLLRVSPKKFRTLAEFCANLGLFFIKGSENSIAIDMPNILKFRDEYTEKQSRKSGQAPDKLQPLLTDTDTEKEEEKSKTPPPPVPGGERENFSGENSLKPQAKKPKYAPKRIPAGTGNSIPELESAINAYAQEPPLRDSLRNYRVMRERIRKPLTGEGMRLAFLELDKIAGPDAETKIAIVNQSVFHSWQGLFPLKKEQPRALPAVRDGPPVARTQFQKGRQDMENLARFVLAADKEFEHGEQTTHRDGIGQNGDTVPAAVDPGGTASAVGYLDGIVRRPQR